MQCSHLVVLTVLYRKPLKKKSLLIPFQLHISWQTEFITLKIYCILKYFSCAVTWSSVVVTKAGLPSQMQYTPTTGLSVQAV